MVGPFAASLSAHRPSARSALSMRSFRCNAHGRARLFWSRRSRRRRPARRLAGVTVRAQLTHLGVGPIERAFVSVFGHMKGHVCQRGSRSRQTQVMVCRLHSSSEPVGRHGRIAIYEGEDGYIGGRVRWGPPSLCSHGPGEPSGGSVRPRGRSLRPDGVPGDQRAREKNPRAGKGVKWSLTGRGASRRNA